jgi:hypothetical protein
MLGYTLKNYLKRESFKLLNFLRNYPAPEFVSPITLVRPFKASLGRHMRKIRNDLG